MAHCYLEWINITQVVNMVCAVDVSHQGWFCLTLMYLHKEQLQCKCFLSHAPHIDRFIQCLPLLQHQLLSFFLWVEFVLFLFAAGHDSRLVFQDNTGHSLFFSSTLDQHAWTAWRWCVWVFWVATYWWRDCESFPVVINILNLRQSA